LWRGFSQITRTRPWRLMMRHFGQRRFTDAETIMVAFPAGDASDAS